MLSVATLMQVAEGQEQRTVSTTTAKQYISRCRVLMRKLTTIEFIREQALELDEDGQPTEHIGLAKGLFKMRMPIDPGVARLLFAAISIDGSLARKRRRG